MPARATLEKPQQPLLASGRAPRRARVAQIRDISRAETLLLGTSGLVAVLALWEVASRQGWINPLVASSPSGIARAAVDLFESGRLMPAIGSTVRLFLLGFGVSLVGGLIVGAIVGWYKRINAVLDPWISILYESNRIGLISII